MEKEKAMENEKAMEKEKPEPKDRQKYLKTTKKNKRSEASMKLLLEFWVRKSIMNMLVII